MRARLVGVEAGRNARAVVAVVVVRSKGGLWTTRIGEWAAQAVAHAEHFVVGLERVVGLVVDIVVHIVGIVVGGVADDSAAAAVDAVDVARVVDVGVVDAAYVESIVGTIEVVDTIE